MGKERRKAELRLEANPFASGVVNEFIPDNMVSMLREKLLSSKEVAVLCRTNSEVSDLYERLKSLEDDDLCKIKIKQDTGLWLSQTREVAEWLDRCEAHPSFNNSDTLYENHPPNDLIRAYQQLPLPDITSACEQIRHLWDISYQSSGRLTLKSHVEQLKELKLSEANRLIQQREDKAILTISTINSVKGLEFDVVFIYPSKASFPFGASWGVEEENISSASLEEMAREEKKLYYVAATRAKQELYYSLGEREKAWSKVIRHSGINSSFMLNGSLGEIKISWSGYAKQNNIQSDSYKYVGTQEYIRTRVKIGDPLRPYVDSHGRIAIVHNNHWIAILEEETANKVKALLYKGYSLRVSAIYRYPVTEQDIAKENPPYWTYFDKVKAQGWLYTVLVSGRIGEI